MSRSSDAQERQRWWKARVAAFESVLGPCDGTVFHVSTALHRGGFADVLRFHKYVAGTAYVTCNLIGNPRQIPNRWGQYDLMICTRNDNDWAPILLSRLARYTHETTIHPGDTMDLGKLKPPESNVAALLFFRPDPPADRIKVLDAPGGLILGVGITRSEFDACRTFGSGVMVRAIREKGIYPFTEMQRAPVT